jgi:hypothetical protein
MQTTAGAPQRFYPCISDPVFDEEDESLSDEEVVENTERWYYAFWEDWTLRVLRNKYVRFLFGKLLDGNKQYCGVEGRTDPSYSDSDL